MRKKKTYLFYGKYIIAAEVELPIEARDIKEATIEAVKLKTLNLPLILTGLNTVQCIDIRKVGK